MTVESASFISQLDTALPASGDAKSEGDNHLRTIKAAVKGSFPNLGASAVTATTAELNYLVGVTSGIQAQMNAEAAARAAGDSLMLQANAVWVSGTTYAVGDLRYSPITFQTYRRAIAGAGTTDPSLDGINWVAVGGSTLAQLHAIALSF